MSTLVRAGLLAALCTAAGTGQAHVSYSNRNFGNLVDGSIVTISNQTVPGNYGWIDAADSGLALDPGLGSSVVGADNLALGDSHKARAFRFHLDTTLTVTFAAAANATATPSSLAGLLPGLSVYQGLAAVSPFAAPQTSADYDFNAASVAWRTTWAQAHLGASYDATATQGSWNAMGDFKMGGDGDPAGVDSALSSFALKGYAWDSDLDGDASLTLTLGPGDYSIFVGGVDIASKGTLTASSPYGLALTVSAVPEAPAALLMLLGLPVLLRRRSVTTARG